MSTDDEFRHAAREDEIDLRDLALMLIDGWYWIAGAILVAVVLAMTYLAVVTPSYSTQLAFTATSDGLRVLNSMPNTTYTEAQVANELSQRLGSYEHFNRFLENSAEERARLGNAFTKWEEGESSRRGERRFFFDSVSVTPADDKSQVHRLRLSYTDGLAGAEFLNNYYRWAVEDYKQVLVQRSERAVENAISRNEAQMQAHLAAYDEEVGSRITRMSEADRIRLAELEDHLEAEKQAVVSSREERIRMLQQAEQIAGRLGITRPTTPRDLGRHPGERDVIYAEINSQGGLPLYFMGTEALQAEREVVEANLRAESKTQAIRDIEKEIQQLQVNRQIEALRLREASSPFNEAYNQLQQQNILMRANLVAPDAIQVAEVIHWAYQPEGPDSPRRTLVLALSLMLGGMLGVMLVFLHRFTTSLRGYRPRYA